MCGITGIFAHSSGRRIDPVELTHMRDAMVHRGPDGGGLWINDDGRVGLAHRRLSIIDVSSTAGQPMTNHDGSVWLTYNGEIYNHLELRAELVSLGYEFVTDHSDTEVLVHGYHAWSIAGLVERIEGDYAFAIWDARSGKLHLARDRIGVKPLYFAMVKDEFVFASEIKGILEHSRIERDVDPLAMYHYLSFLTTPAPLTMFKSIYKLPAGFFLTVDDAGALEATRYWDAKPGKFNLERELSGLGEKAQESLLIDGIRTRLRAAVHKRMMSDVPIGVFLSGGIDSSTNVALMAETTDVPTETFSVGFKDFQHLNELEYAQQISRIHKTNHHEVLIDEGDMKSYLSDLIYSQDEPLADWVCIPLYFVSKLAKDNGVTVVQVGEGSDEEFCGYSGYMTYLELYRKYWQPYRRITPRFAQNILAGAAKRAGRMLPQVEVYADILDRAARDREHFWSGATVFWDTLKARLVRPGSIIPNGNYGPLIDAGLMDASLLVPDTFNVVQAFNRELHRTHPDHSILDRMVYSEFKLRLPELLLMRVDKIGMSVSLEARVPFLDHELVEYALDIPMEYKIKGWTPKYILKKAVEGIIPDEIIYRKKMGFGAPMSQWLSGDFGLQVRDEILGSSLMHRGFFDVDYIAELIRDHRSGRRDNSLYIWTLYNLSAWYEYWIASASRGKRQRKRAAAEG